LNIKRLKYQVSSFRTAMRIARNNFRIIEEGKSLHVDSEFEIIDSNLEGYNYLFGRGILAKSRLGLFTYVQHDSYISNAHIGRFCSIGPNVLVGLGEHPTEFLSTHPLFYESSYIKDIQSLTTSPLFSSHETVNIGSDVWIGANCYIKDGVTIGDGAIVGTGAVVTKDISPYSIAVGVPAAVIKRRFDDDTISELMELKWWNWEISKILENKDLFQGKLRNEVFIRMSK
jgi:acetyltransferase-like isoleucine patch superfamily enzyme